MRKSSSGLDIKTSTRNTSDETKTSYSAKKGDDTKKSADNTDHTTVSSSFCGCKKDKCDAFFDKLLCYLEKQSAVIAKCCAHSRDRRDSHEKLVSSDRERQRRHPSPCNDEPNAYQRSRNSTEALKTLKGKGNFKEELEPVESKISKFRSDGGRNPCKIFVEVCSCQKDGRKAIEDCLDKIMEEEPERRSQKSKPRSQDQYATSRSNEYGFDCQGCEKKVSQFFKLAEEICQAYLKQCQDQDNLNRVPSTMSLNKGLKSNESYRVLQRPPSNRNLAQRWYEGSSENQEPPCARPIAIEIECEGTKEQFVVEPCQCVEKENYGRAKSSKSAVLSRAELPHSKKSCLEVFEERYGKMLRDLHAKLIGNPNPYQGPYSPTGYQNPYGDYAPQQPPQQPQPPYQQPQPPYQQPQPPYQPHQPSFQQMQPPPVQQSYLQQQAPPSQLQNTPPERPSDDSSDEK